MDYGFLNEFIVPVIAGICFLIGYILKKWVKDVENKYIPTILGILGVGLAIWVNGWAITPDVLLQGLVSGLGATGLHQAVTRVKEDNNGVL